MEAVAPTHAPVRKAGRLSRGRSDADLVARLRAGDDTAFESIYDRHHHGLFGFCRHMLGSREEAEDAIQHVFLAVHRNLRAGEQPVVLKPWLYAVARNRCLNMLAARRQGASLDDIPEPSTDGLAVAAAVERRQDLQALLGDLAGLPDDQRAALLLAELGDLSHDEIAQALEVRRDKVKALVFQARTSLMHTRDARDTDCRSIQETLANGRGAELRRGNVRKHVAICPECAAFKANVRRQRAELALVLPVLPLATLKGSVLASVLGGGGGSGAAVVGAGSAGATGGLLGGGSLGKVALALAIAGGVGGGTVVAVNRIEGHHRHHIAAPVPGVRAPRPTSGSAGTHAPATPVAAKSKPTHARHHRAPGHVKHHASAATGKLKAAGKSGADHASPTGAAHGLKIGHTAKGEHGRSDAAPGHTVVRTHPAHTAHPVRTKPVRAVRTPPATAHGANPQKAVDNGKSEVVTAHQGVGESSTSGHTVTTG